MRWLALLVLLAGCADTERAKAIPEDAAFGAETERSSRAAGTEKMIRRLELIADNMTPISHPFLNHERVELFRQRALPEDPAGRLRSQLELAVELLRVGKSQEAADRFTTILEELRRDPERHPTGLLRRVQDQLAIAHLRLGEQQNCLERHVTDSCLMPISDSGVHRLQEGSRAAMTVYAEILRDDPEDLMSRWLYNLAAMTVGDYPHDVPTEWLIPPEVFASDHDIGRFHDVAAGAGLDTISTAGGSLVDDFDGDGYLDVMVSSWGLRDPLRYFHNRRDGTFAEKTREAGIEGLFGGLNLIHADYDNDGDNDVLVLRGGWLNHTGRQPNSLLANDGHGFFEDVTEVAGLLSFHPTQAAAWGDVNNDGWLDLFIGNESSVNEPHPGELYLNKGPGPDGIVTFTEIATEAGVRTDGPVKGVALGDYDNDGWLDLYVSRITAPNLLYRNLGVDDPSRPRFTEVGAAAGTREPLNSFPTWFFDVDNDGWLDLFVGDYANEFLGARGTEVVKDYLGEKNPSATARLYRNQRDGTFADATVEAGLDHTMLVMGANFGDLDNDGWPDIYAGTGAPAFQTLIPNRMFRNAGDGTFQEVTTSGGFGHLQKGHGVSFADIDNDGDQDIFAVMGGAFVGDVYQNVLFANPGHGQRWITLRLEGVRANRSAIGARIRLDLDTPNGPRQVFTTVSTGGSFGGSSLQQEIGLGDATAIRSAEIAWPGTDRQIFHDLPMEKIVHLREGDPEPKIVGLDRLELSHDAPHAH